MSAVIQEKLKILQSAINYEIDQHYINAKGKKNTFSNFIIQNAKTLSSVLNDKNQLKSLINLFYAYPVQDITARMYTIHKAQEILKEISDKNKRSSIETPQRGVSMTNKTFEKDPKKIDVKYVKGVGPKMSLVLNRLGIFSVNDLFQYYPRTYIDYQKQLPIKDLRLDDSVTICGTIKSIKAYNPPKRKDLTIFTICVEDGTGKINITKFIAGKFGRIILAQYKKQYHVGAKVVCSGTGSFDKYSSS